MVVLVKPAELPLLLALVACLLGANGVACRHLSFRCADPRFRVSCLAVEMSRGGVRLQLMAVFRRLGMKIALVDAFARSLMLPTLANSFVHALKTGKGYVCEMSRQHSPQPRSHFRLTRTCLGCLLPSLYGNKRMQTSRPSFCIPPALWTLMSYPSR